MSRSKSLVIAFSSLCALAACARIPASNANRRPAHRIVVQEPMGNPSATVQPRMRVEPVDDLRLMEPDFGTEPSQAAVEPSYNRAPILNLEGAVAPAARPAPVAPPARVAPVEDVEDSQLSRRKPPTVPIDQPNDDELVGPRSR